MGLISHVASLLDQAGLKYQEVEGSLILLWKTDHFDELIVRIVPSSSEDWLYIYAPFPSIKELSKEDQVELAFSMLRESWKMNGVKLALDPDDDIVVLSETNDRDLTAEEINMLVGNVVRACDRLWELHREAVMS